MLKSKLIDLDNKNIKVLVDVIYVKILQFIRDNPEQGFPFRIPVKYFFDVSLKPQDIFSNNEWQEEYFDDSEDNFAQSDFWINNGSAIINSLREIGILLHYDYLQSTANHLITNVVGHDPETYEAVWGDDFIDRQIGVNYFLVSIIDEVEHNKKKELVLEKEQAYQQKIKSYTNLIDNKIVIYLQEFLDKNKVLPKNFMIKVCEIFPVKEVCNIYDEDYGLEVIEEEDFSRNNIWIHFSSDLIDYYKENDYHLILTYTHSGVDISGDEDYESPRINFFHFEKY